MNKCLKVLVAALTLSLLAAGGAWADKKPAQVVDEARAVLKEVMASPDRSIPKDLLKSCAGVAIVPSVVKGGFVLGGAFGRGVVLSKSASGNWSGPAFIDMGGGSLGFQVGLQAIDLILVVMNERGMKSFLKSKFKLGADVGVAAGPAGRRAEASSDLQFKAEIYSYSRSKGLFAGVSLEGMVVSVNEEFINQYYGEPWSVDDILFKKKSEPPDSGEKLIELLATYSR